MKVTLICKKTGRQKTIDLQNKIQKRKGEPEK